MESDDEDLPIFDSSAKKKKTGPRNVLTSTEEEVDFSTLKKRKKRVQTELKPQDDSYSYEFLLSRVYGVIQTAGSKEGVKLKVPALELGRMGPRKTIWINFEKVCLVIKRNPESVMKYVLVELGTKGNFNAERAFIINERTQETRIERILRNYISEYVVCKNCKTYDTYIERRSKLDFLVCKNCNSERSLVKIDPGFQALVKKRATLKC